MTETEFLVQADAVLRHVQEAADNWFEKLDVDVDVNREGYVVTLIFNAKSHVVVNAQTPLQEMWLAAPSGAFHYRFVDGQWVNTRENAPTLNEQISIVCSVLAGQTLSL
ncbi:iron donor protein CyaY [Pelistega europaea]|uniref:Iron-sulfur cluster assembly protein CyaY n=1 Tax=Pelistega europaea TaxID=106147 RepID=A0A7Y4P3R8_9BURK|nr:iron donor protein CyaY [Pelistega europaea]NOL48736.1 iron donor protein CyaY [Pelistega europaea]